MAQSSLWKGDPEIEAAIAELEKMAKYPLDVEIDSKFMRELREEFPTVDLAEEVKKWRTWMMEHDSKRKVKYRARFRTWCRRAAEWQSRPRSFVRGVAGVAGQGLSARPERSESFGATSDRLEQW